MFKKLQTFLSEVNWLKFFVTSYSVCATVWFAFSRERIVEGLRNFFDYPFKGVLDVWVLIYSIILLAWAFASVRYLWNEGKTTRENHENLKKAIFRAPNPKVYLQYKGFYAGIFKLKDSDWSNLTSCAENIKAALEIVRKLTASFVNQSGEGNIYGTNIMIYFPASIHQGKFDKLKKQTQEWIHFRDVSFEAFSGVLYLIPSLSDCDPANKQPPAKPICFPVKLNGSSNIPGAPMAAIRESFVFSNVRDTEKYYAALGNDEKKIGEQYWKDNLLGVTGIFSMAIPYTWNASVTNSPQIIGVLNIDSSKEDVLGTSAEYHETLISLLYPIVCQLSIYVARYYDLYIIQNQDLVYSTSLDTKPKSL